MVSITEQQRHIGSWQSCRDLEGKAEEGVSYPAIDGRARWCSTATTWESRRKEKTPAAVFQKIRHRIWRSRLRGSATFLKRFEAQSWSTIAAALLGLSFSISSRYALYNLMSRMLWPALNTSKPIVPFESVVLPTGCNFLLLNHHVSRSILFATLLRSLFICDWINAIHLIVSSLVISLLHNLIPFIEWPFRSYF